MRISELAESAGLPASTVGYYERIGLMALPARTSSGYRDYGDEAAARLLFISRARRMGLSCEQIISLIPVWAGTNCSAAHDRVGRLIEEKQAEIAERIAQLEQFAAQLDAVRAALDAQSPPQACRSDLTCRVPESAGLAVAIELKPRPWARSRGHHRRGRLRRRLLPVGLPAANGGRPGFVHAAESQTCCLRAEPGARTCSLVSCLAVLPRAVARPRSSSMVKRRMVSPILSRAWCRSSARRSCH